MKYTLLIDCTDQQGLIYHISHTLFSFGMNILEMKEHVDESTGTFYMRCEFTGQQAINQIKQKLHKHLPSANIRIHPKDKKNIVVFATKEYHCISDILLRHQFGELNANILAVVANHPDLESIVTKFEQQFILISHLDKNKEEYEKELLNKLNEFKPDYLVLAKYLRILSPEFVAHYPSRIINIHHSFLPAFIGAHPYRQAFERGIKIIGATAHFVTNHLDEGPIITQQTTQVDHTYSAEDMKRSGRDIERLALAQALDLVFDDRVFVKNNKTVIL